eukprot:SAG22_NODE_814_length_7044_cov_24.348884_2_plen_192_part_00
MRRGRQQTNEQLAFFSSLAVATAHYRQGNKHLLEGADLMAVKEYTAAMYAGFPRHVPFLAFDCLNATAGHSLRCLVRSLPVRSFRCRFSLSLRHRSHLNPAYEDAYYNRGIRCVPQLRAATAAVGCKTAHPMMLRARYCLLTAGCLLNEHLLSSITTNSYLNALESKLAITDFTQVLPSMEFMTPRSRWRD